jgi:hypothetical protein
LIAYRWKYLLGETVQINRQAAAGRDDYLLTEFEVNVPTDVRLFTIDVLILINIKPLININDSNFQYCDRFTGRRAAAAEDGGGGSGRAPEPEGESDRPERPEGLNDATTAASAASALAPRPH